MPVRVKGAWNLISKLAIALIWKTPTRLKFGKTKIYQEQNILTFVYNKTGADSSEWFEPAEDAKVSGQGGRQQRTSRLPNHAVNSRLYGSFSNDDDDMKLPISTFFWRTWTQENDFTIHVLNLDTFL